MCRAFAPARSSLTSPLSPPDAVQAWTLCGPWNLRTESLPGLVLSGTPHSPHVTRIGLCACSTPDVSRWRVAAPSDSLGSILASFSLDGARLSGHEWLGRVQVPGAAFGARRSGGSARVIYRPQSELSANPALTQAQAPRSSHRGAWNPQALLTRGPRK